MEVKLSRFYRDKPDGVTYTAVGEDGKKREHKRRACYMAVLSKPGAWEVTCRPNGPQNSAPPLAFQRFFRELQRTGLLPKPAEFGTRRGRNFLVVPRRNWGYHPVFVTLSLYRHADCHGKSILGRTMRLYDQLRKEGTHFLQCFHWTLVNTSYGSWHSCFNLGVSPYEGHEVKNRDLKYGLGIAHYGKLTLTEKNALHGRHSTTMFDTLAQRYRDIQVEDLDDILDPQYAKYYQDPELARKQ